ncbi:hypothetical protein JCM8202_001408 [Rhodotorula sphaerocarpa]
MRQATVFLSAALLPAAVLAVQRRGGPAFDRRVAVNAARTIDRSNEAAEAKILDPQTECSYYNYAPVNEIIHTYPPIWKTANLSTAGIEAAARDLFANISGSIPNIPVRGNRYGNWSNVHYNYDQDPDCWWSATNCVTPKLPGLKNDTVACGEANTWGYTLDDGPNCSHNAFYDYLQSIDQKATVFYIGSNVLDWPLEAQRGLQDGHEICAHTWSHPYMTGVTNEEVFAELYYSKKAIKELTGVTPRCWRPPYGDVDNRVRYVAEKLDLATIVWDEDTDDWSWQQIGVPAVRARYQAILAAQAAGNFSSYGPIVLSHELDNETMSLSMEFLPQIRKQFTGGVMPIAVCQNNSRPYVETQDYVYPNYEQWQSGTHSVSLATPTAGAVKTLALSASSTPTSASSVASMTASGPSRSAASTGSSSTMATKSASSPHQKNTSAASSQHAAWSVAATTVVLALAGSLLA